MSSSNPCIIAAREALTLFTDEELKRYTRQVLEQARSYGDLKGSAAINRAIEDINNEKMQQLTGTLQIKTNSAAKYERMAQKIKDKKVGLLDLVARRYTNLADNIESSQRAARKMLSDAFFGQLTEEEFVHLRDGKNSLEIMGAISGRTNVSSLAKSIAKKFDDYVNFRNSEMVQSDALSIYQLNKDRFLRAIHNQQLLINGGKPLIGSILSFGKTNVEESRNVWREFIKQHLDLEKTFRDTDAIDLDGKLDMQKADQILNTIFDNITTDKPEIFSFGRGSQNMFFYWKDMENMYNYAQRYGHKDLFSMMMADVMQSGNRIGMAQMFGDSPLKMFNDLAELQAETNPVSKRISFNTKNTFNYLAGIDQSPVSSTLANFGSTLRSLTSMKSLGKIAFLSLPDIANGITFAKRWGFDYWESYTTYMGGLFNALPNEERQYLASTFREMTDHHMGYVGRFLEANNVPQLVNTASAYFYRGIGMESLDKGNKVSSLYVLSKNLGRMSERSFDELPELTRKQMAKFDFTQREWDLLRGKNERGLFTLDNVNAITNDELKKAFGASSDQPLYLLKNELYRKVYSMFDVWADNAVLTPGAYMRSMVTGGSRSGTIWGEFLRTIMQFKTYSMQFVDRVLYQGFRDSDGAQAKLAFAIQLMAATIPMSFLSYYLNNLASGRSMPSWSAMNFDEKKRYAMEIMLPSAGLLTSIFDPNRQNQDLIMNAFNTPSLKVLSNGMSGVLALTGGDAKKFTQSMKKVGQGITPGLSLPFIDPYLREMMGEKAHLQPGQVQLYGK